MEQEWNIWNMLLDDCWAKILESGDNFTYVRDRITSKFILVQFDDGNVIINQDQNGDDFFIIVEGINDKKIFISLF